jgi:hypothetical protein
MGNSDTNNIFRMPCLWGTSALSSLSGPFSDALKQSTQKVNL